MGVVTVSFVPQGSTSDIAWSTAQMSGQSRHAPSIEAQIATTLAFAAFGGLAAKGIMGVSKVAQVAGALRSTKAFQIFRTIKRPVTSTMTRLGYSGIPEKIVTRYGYAKFGIGLLDPLASTRALSRGDYDEAIIGFYGPPGSVNLYRKVLESLASSSSPSQQNGGAKGNKKTRGDMSKSQFKKWMVKHHLPFYTPKHSAKCRNGYYKEHGFCVKK